MKVTLRRARTELKAPISGMAQQLAVTTLGQVFTAGQPLMVVVPTDGPIEVEAQLQNKDIGFILPGQEAVVKIDSFPFTRYGSIEERVERVSRDAVDDREAGGGSDALLVARSRGVNPVTGMPKTQNLIFPVTVVLSQTFIKADGKDVLSISGMAATVEIRTGRRWVIDCLLSPERETTAAAGHER